MLLRYFGEELPAPCGNCDTCLEPPETFDGTVAAQKALSCAVRTGQRFGAQHLIAVLRGSKNDRLLRWGHHRLPTYGVGADLSQNQWRGVIRQLVARGYLAVDPEGHGGLQLTAAATPVLRGEERLELRQDTFGAAGGAAAEGRTGRRRRTAALDALSGDVAQLDGETEALFDRLRARRKALAEEQGVPPYVIFHDRTLAAMALHRPASAEALLRINGVGQAKLDRYGEVFLAEIHAAADPG
jgi:ATP-dependent DNA helicase RecQ